MAFNLQYLPDPFALASASNAIGMADYAEKQRALAQQRRAEKERRAAEAARLGLDYEKFDAQQAQQAYENEVGQQQFAEELAIEQQRQAQQAAAQQQAQQLRRNAQITGGNDSTQNRLMGYFDRMMGDQQGFEQDVFLRELGFNQQNRLQERGIQAENQQQEREIEVESAFQQSQAALKFAERNEARARADWQAVQEAWANGNGSLTEEQYVDAQQQVIDRFEALGIEPPVGGVRKPQKTAAEIQLEQLQANANPGERWIMGPKNVPINAIEGNPETDPVYAQQQQQRKRDLIEYETKTAFEAEQRKAAQDERKQRIADRNSELSFENGFWQATAPKEASFKDANTGVVNRAEFKKALDEHNAARNTALNAIRSKYSQPSQSNQQPVAISSEQDAIDRGLPDGTPIILNGRRGTWKNP
jgi:hypothetical protein